MEEKEIDFKLLFPNLIIYIGPDKNERLLRQLNKSFQEFKYGHLHTDKGTSFKNGCQISTIRIVLGKDNPLCLAEGEGPLICDAESQAAEKLFKKLCNSCYVIRANPTYFSRSKVPPYALNADASHSHIYKVVFLKKNLREVPFPLPVSGAVDYVEDYKELMEYIETHAKSDSKADLFILNVLKTDRASIKTVVKSNGMLMSNLVGCSNQGLYVHRHTPTREILQDLLQCGGETVKYKIIGPRDQFGDVEDKVDNESAAVQNEALPEGKEEIVINPWIADRLVLMEGFTENNEPDSPREIIWRSVRDCPDTQEFIIEKTTTNVAMIHAAAMIDRNVVGRARGFAEKRVKKEAADDAMQNLRKCCYYIATKNSYFGLKNMQPGFLKEQHGVKVTKLYRIAMKTTSPYYHILKQFKKAQQEDIYFRWDFERLERDRIAETAKQMGFLVRWVGPCLCVYKKRKPKDVLTELLATRTKENKKYKLLIPPAKIHPGTEGSATQDWNEIYSNDTQGWDNQRSSHDTGGWDSERSSHDTKDWNNQRSSHDTEGWDNESPSHDTKDWNSQRSSHDTMDWNNEGSSHDTKDWNSQRPSHETQDWNNERSSRDTKDWNSQSSSHDTKDWNSERSSHDTQDWNSQRSSQDTKDWNNERSSHDTQGWDSQISSHDTQANITPSSSRRVIYNDSQSLSNPQASKHQTLHSDLGGTSQSSSHGNNNETPSWVMKFIQSAPPKPGKPLAYTRSRPAQAPSQREDGCARYSFTPPKLNQSSASSSNTNFHASGQWQDQSVHRDNADPYKDKGNHQNDAPANQSLDHKSTLSERLQTLLKEYQMNTSRDEQSSNSGSNQVVEHSDKKRPYDRGPDVKEECEPTSKYHKSGTNPHSSQFSGLEGRFSINKSYDKPFTEDSGLAMDTDVQYRNPYSSRVKVEEESSKDASQLFHRRPESSQNTTSMWDKGTKQQYDQRSNTSAGGPPGPKPQISNLFDYSGPQDIEFQDPARPPRLTRPPPSWKRNQLQQKSKGHSFSKLEKYGKNRGGKRPFFH